MNRFSTPQGSHRLVRVEHALTQMSPQKYNKRRTSSLNMNVDIWQLMQNYQAKERKARRRATNPLARSQKVTDLMTPQIAKVCWTSIGRLPRGTAREPFVVTDNKAWTDKIPPKMNTVEVMAILEAVTTISQRCPPADKSQWIISMGFRFRTTTLVIPISPRRRSTSATGPLKR